MSAAILGALCDACLHGFELFGRSRGFARDHTVLLTRLDGQRAILTFWGDAVGISFGIACGKSENLKHHQIPPRMHSHDLRRLGSFE